MNMGIDTFEKKMNEGYYDIKHYVEKKYIIDEDKTVKENRRLEEEHNKAESAKREEVSKHRAEKAKEFKKDLREAIKNYSHSNLNDKQVEHIAEYADEHFERFPVEYYVSDICNLVDIIDKVVNAS